MTLAERFDTWAQQYEEKGMAKGVAKGVQQGIAKGEAQVLARLLTKRFGALPPEAAQAIATASAKQIDIRVDRLLDANSLDEVLRPSQ